MYRRRYTINYKNIYETTASNISTKYYTDTYTPKEPRNKRKRKKEPKESKNLFLFDVKELIA